MVIAFDVYGTLVNTAGIARALSAYTDDSAGFAARLRDKQLEYTFRRAVMGRYAGFTECTRAALDFVCEERGVDISAPERIGLMDAYAFLPAFDDARACLRSLAKKDVRTFAFSNGEEAAVRRVLGELSDYLTGVVSVEAVSSFKPDGRVYAHFLKQAGVAAAEAWLVSGNPFDVMGARAAGWNAAWVQRGSAVFDPWAESELRPSAIIRSLAELPAIFD